tara:strand:+ start:693 stop:1424 length:732 start_codon:yes stop_codon:yes gene_type:complete
VSWQELAADHATREAPCESVGLLVVIKGRERYRPCKNISTEPRETFVIDPEDWASAEDEGHIIAVIHSHPQTTPEPSREDQQACDALGLPWHIYSVLSGSWGVCRPQHERLSLIGRVWSWIYADCWTLTRDFYALHAIELPDWQRPRTFEDFMRAPMFGDCWPLAGFRELESDEQLIYGDALLFDMHGTGLDHVGVYLGDMDVLHHLKGRLSSRDLYGALLQSSTVKRLRHCSVSTLEPVAIG